MKTETLKRRVSSVLVLLFLFALLCGCGPVFGHPDNLFLKYPNEKWTCRELDMVAYTLDGEYRMYGFCTLDGQTYSVQVDYGLHNRVAFMDFYATAEKKASESDPEKIRYEYLSAEVLGKITRQEDTGALVFTQTKEEAFSVNGVEIPKTLTFERAGSIEDPGGTRYATADTFFSVAFLSREAKVMKGTVKVDGKKKKVLLYPYGDDGCFTVELRNSVVMDGNYYWHDLVKLSMAFFDDRIEATVCDVYNGEEETFANYYPVWHRFFYDVKTVTFRATPVE